MANLSLNELDELIRTGKAGEVRRHLKNINLSQLSRKQRVQFARLCSRSGIFELGLKALRKFVYPENTLITPTNEELCEYGHALTSIGGGLEAIGLLKDVESVPRAKLITAFAYFSQWSYPSSLPFLEDYLSLVDENSYEYLIGQVNYAAALLGSRKMEAARELLLNILGKIEESDHRILRGNCRELMAQIYFRRGNLLEATKLLNLASSDLGNKYPDALFVDKWNLLITIKDSQITEMNSKIIQFREICHKHFDWETLRDFDYQLCQINGDELLFNKTYFGTPYEFWRKTALSEVHFPVHDTYHRNLGDNDTEDSVEIELESLHNGSNPIFKMGSLYHRLFEMLAQDFYRPHRLVQLFSLLHPDEYFDPEFSSKKMRVLMVRLRKMLLPLGIEIEERSGQGYFLKSQKNLTFIYSNVTRSIEAEDAKLREIDSKFPDGMFSSEEVATLFGVSKRTAVRWLNEYIEQGQVEKKGEKKGAHYCRIF